VPDNKPGHSFGIILNYSTQASGFAIFIIPLYLYRTSLQKQVFEL